MVTDSATTAPTATGAHPLAPLTASEVERAAQIVRDEKRLPASYRFVSISLHEPPKDHVLGWDGDVPLERRASVVLYDRAGKSTYEAVVSLTGGAVCTWRERIGVQPPLLLEEFAPMRRLICQGADQGIPLVRGSRRSAKVCPDALRM
jgi:primary-amine oxidase